MHLRMLHQPDIRITQPAAEGRHSAPVRTERVTIIILPEDTLRNHTAQTRSNTGQTTQLLHKTAAETLHENHQNIGPLRRKQRVPNITARLWIQTPHKVRTLRLRKQIITPGQIIARPHTRSKSIHRIHRSMVGQNLLPNTINITLAHKPQARNHQENPYNADIAHPQTLATTRRKTLRSKKNARKHRPQSQRKESPETHQNIRKAHTISNTLRVRSITQHNHAKLETPVLIQHSIAGNNRSHSNPHQNIIRHKPSPQPHRRKTQCQQTGKPRHNKQHRCHNNIMPQ